jgi:hypothetical protein
MRWTLKIEKLALSIAILVAVSSLRCVISNAASSLPYLSNGATIISQDCLPRRQRQVDVTEVYLVCDHQAATTDDDTNEGDGNGNNYNYNRDTSYTSKATCRPGDLGKVAIGCK